MKKQPNSNLQEKEKKSNRDVRIFPDLIYLRFNRLPPSENHAMLQKGWKKFPSKELKEWRKYVLEEVVTKPIILENKVKRFRSDEELEGDPWLQADIRIYMDLNNKGNGRVKRFDVHNRIKYMLDVICERLVWNSGEPVDDKYFKRVIATKIDTYRPAKKVYRRKKRFSELVITPYRTISHKLQYSINEKPPILVSPNHWWGKTTVPYPKRLLSKEKKKSKTGARMITI